MPTQKPDKPTYIFGYGSLCYPSGINGRGMRKQYDWNDLRVATLNGYERGMNAFGVGLPWYGVKPRHGSFVNGVIFKIYTQHDLDSLYYSEHIDEVYTFDDVVENITGVDLEPNACVFTCVTIPRGPPYSGGNMGYVLRVYDNISHWGEEFVEMFKKTTVGVNFDDVEKRLKEMHKTYGDNP